MGDALRELPLEPLIYEAGGLAFSFALLGFAYTTRRLLRLVGRGWAWLLPLAGAGLMLAVVGLHFYATVLYPVFHAGDPGLMLAIYRFRFVALLAMLASSVVTVAGAGLVWRAFTGARAKAG